VDRLTYNIPAAMAGSYRDLNIIVRSHDPLEFIECLSKDDLKNLLYIQLLSLSSDVDILLKWGVSVPVDLVMANPDTEFPLLYKHAELLNRHPVRVSIPVTRGFNKVVRLAASLNFAVKLEIGQLDGGLVEEMFQTLNFYLHHSTVSQPIEYFHSILMAFYHERPITIWEIQEEDPGLFRYVTNQGKETISKRFVEVDVRGDLASFIEEFKLELLAEKRECYSCEFLDNCGGYFKWPHKEFGCDQVKTIFQALKDAAIELKKDYADSLDFVGEDRS
jgi:hypothetical protein